MSNSAVLSATDGAWRSRSSGRRSQQSAFCIGLLLALVAMLTVLAAPALASSGVLSGRVSDGSGASLSGVAVDLFSGSTRITGATTAASGTYSVGVADGTYDIVVTPPTGSGLTASTFSAFTVSGSTNLNVVLVRQAVTFSGVLRTTQGVPMPLTTVSLTGSSTASTTTSSTGAFSLAVAPGTYSLARVPVLPGNVAGLTRDISTSRFPMLWSCPVIGSRI